MPLESQNDQVTAASLQDIRAALRRRSRIVFAGLLVGLALGVAAAAILPAPTPTATVGVELRATGLDPAQPQGRTTAALDVDRRIVAVTSDATMELAVATFGSPLSADELRDAVEVRQIGKLPLIRITVSHESEDAAVAAAAAVADAALEVERERALAVREGHDALFLEQLDELYADIGALGAAIGEAQEAARVARLDADGEPIDDATTSVDTGAASRAAALEGQRDAALRRATELESSRAALITHNVEPGEVVEGARANDVSGGPGAALIAPALGFLGLLAGLVLALLLDRFDRRLWTPEDVTRVTGSTQVLAIERSDLIGDGLRTGGGHRRLRTLTIPREGTATVLLTSLDPQLGAAIAAGLSAAVAGIGRPVVLIEVADQDAFGLPSGDVDGWLNGSVGLQKAARSPDGVPGIQVLRGRASTELAASSTLAQLLEAPNGVVILHVPGGSEAGDVLALASQVDRVVLVIGARKDNGDDVARAARWLARDSRDEPVLVITG